MDEVKTGAKLAWGGACEYFNVKPDIICLGKSIGGGFSLAAFAASREIMDRDRHAEDVPCGHLQHQSGGDGGGHRHVPASADARRIRAHRRLNRKLVDGYQAIIEKNGLVAYADGAGANGALLFYPQRIRNYRDWYHVDEDVWTHYWFAMVNRGVLAQPYWWDEQWTISVQHTDAGYRPASAGVRGRWRRRWPSRSRNAARWACMAREGGVRAVRETAS